MSDIEEHYKLNNKINNLEFNFVNNYGYVEPLKKSLIRLNWEVVNKNYKINIINIKKKYFQ